MKPWLVWEHNGFIWKVKFVYEADKDMDDDLLFSIELKISFF